MKWKIVIFIVVILGIVGVLAYIYLTYDLPQQKIAFEYSNISISANERNIPDKYVVVGFEITGGQIDIRGQTLSQGSILESVPSNYSYQICSFNVPNQVGYYSSCQNFDTFNSADRHISLIVQRPGEISLSGEGSLNENNSNLTLDIKLISGDSYLNPFVCYNESFDILNVNANLPSIPQPSGYGNYLNCYSLPNLNSANSSISIPINYASWNALNSQDYIGIAVGDEDYFNGQWVASYNGTDVGGENKNFVFKYNNNI